MFNLKDLKSLLTLQIIQYVSDVFLLVATALGLFTQWYNTRGFAFSFVCISAVIMSAVSCGFKCFKRCNMQEAADALFHLWAGCMMGILAYCDSSSLQHKTTHNVMEWLFLTSLVLGIFWHVLSRFMKLTDPYPGILGIAEGLESLGLVIGGIVTGNSGWVLGMMTLAFVTHIAALRLKSSLLLISLADFVLISILSIFPSLSLRPNVKVLVCIAGRIALPAVLDFFSGYSMLERWYNVVFIRPRIPRYLSLVGILVLDTALACLIGISTREQKLLFGLFWVLVLVWLLLHLVFFVTCYKLMGKVTQCNRDLCSRHDPASSYPRIMTARGLRHFVLVTQRFICLSLFSTVVLKCLGLATQTQYTPYSLALAFIVLPLEALTLSLFWELGDKLGGSCTAYALISPVTALRSNNTLMSVEAVKKRSKRITNIKDQAEHFFTFHLLNNYGCDLFDSGLDIDSIHSKLNAFFGQCTNEGPRYDTYLLYFCGDVLENGDWAVTGYEQLTLDTLLEWWKAKNGNSGARLMLILDSPHSYIWAQKVKQIPDDFVCVQTCRYIQRHPDLETMESGLRFEGVGSFTKAYMEYNTGQKLSLDWSGKQRPLKAIYTVSRCWTNFVFHLPTWEDYEQYWVDNCHHFTRPLVYLLVIPGVEKLFCCCSNINRWLRQQWMFFFPPSEMDTGHGFKLVES